MCKGEGLIGEDIYCFCSIIGLQIIIFQTCNVFHAMLRGLFYFCQIPVSDEYDMGVGVGVGVGVECVCHIS